MIFAQYKHAFTFAVVILSLAVVVADPGKDDATVVVPAAQDDTASLAATAAAPAPQAAPSADTAWYGVTGEDAAAPPAEDPAPAFADDGGYRVAPAPAPAPGYIPPPPPPQVPPSH